MGTKSRESLYGASVRAAAEQAAEARKTADRLACEAWNKRMLGFQGHCAVRARAYRIEDDPGLVVDQIIRVISKEWVHAGPGYPCCLRVRERHLLGRLASMAA